MGTSVVPDLTNLPKLSARLTALGWSPPPAPTPVAPPSTAEEPPPGGPPAPPAASPSPDSPTALGSVLRGAWEGLKNLPGALAGMVTGGSATPEELRNPLVRGSLMNRGIGSAAIDRELHEAIKARAAGTATEPTDVLRSMVTFPADILRPSTELAIDVARGEVGPNDPAYYERLQQSGAALGGVFGLEAGSRLGALAPRRVQLAGELQARAFRAAEEAKAAATAAPPTAEPTARPAPSAAAAPASPPPPEPVPATTMPLPGPGAAAEPRSLPSAEEAQPALAGNERGAVPLYIPEPKTVRAVRDLLSPASVSPEATATAETLRAHLGEMARTNEVARTQLNEFRKQVPQLTTPEGRDFVAKMEAGTAQATPGLQPAADAIRGALDDARTQVQDLGTGKLEHFIENYFPHIWEDPDQAKSVIQQMLATRPMQGSRSFLKQRIIPTIEEGLQLGLKPAADHPIDMALLKLREMNRYLMAQKAFADLKSQGLVQAVKLGDRAPAGYDRIHDSIARVGQSEYWAPKDAAHVLNNYLSPGLRGHPLYDAYMGVGNVLNQAQLGLSAFHLGFTSMDAGVSRVALGIEQGAGGVKTGDLKLAARGLGTMATAPLAPFTGYLQGSKLLREYLRPGSQGGELAELADAITQGGGRVRMDDFYKSGAIDGFLKALRRKDVISAGARAIPAMIELAAKPVLEHVVPRQKLGVFADLARREIEKLGPNPTTAAVRSAMSKAWDSVDNRMGQLVYDNLFWNKTLKDVSMASVRSVGWNVGTVRELGGGALDLARGQLSHRAAYVLALPTTVGLAGAILQYLYTGQGPQALQDYFQPRTGRKDPDGNEERVQLPSYMKDVFAVAKHPIETVMHKSQPLIGILADMLSNKNYYGDEIRNPDDPAVKQAKQVAEYLGKQVMPFSVQNILEEKKRDQSTTTKALATVGVTPAKREDVRSPAQNEMAQYLARHRPGGRSPEEVAEAERRATIREGLRTSAVTGTDLRAEVHAGTLSSAEARRLAHQARIPPLVGRFAQLPIAEAIKVYQLGTPEEQTAWRLALAKKARNKVNPVAQRREAHQLVVPPPAPPAPVAIPAPAAPAPRATRVRVTKRDASGRAAEYEFAHAGD